MRWIAAPALVLATVTGCVREVHYDYHPETTYSYAQNVTFQAAPVLVAPSPPAPVAPPASEPPRVPAPVAATVSTARPRDIAPRPPPGASRTPKRPPVEMSAPPVARLHAQSTPTQLVPAFDADDRQAGGAR